MTTLLSSRRTEPSVPAGGPATHDELVLLVLLREAEVAGSLTGLEILDTVAGVARIRPGPAPTYRLVHDLVDEGLLRTADGRPPRYAVTDAGRAESRRLAAAWWPRIDGMLRTLSARLRPDTAEDPVSLTPSAAEPPVTPPRASPGAAQPASPVESRGDLPRRLAGLLAV